MGPGLRRDDGFVFGRSAQELLLQDAFLEVGLVVEQQRHRDVAVFMDLDRDDVARFGEIGDGADRALVGFKRLDAYTGAFALSAEPLRPLR